ncbi:AAA family ATPase [Streptacidiphilus pinicola]|uniref:AAA family ATPase n=1 Tax=Streptacidiphilus pinicola TaxID=2219663 RepID=UPI001FB2E6BC|nr:AAA family ATPase [Streptacidiphilus pinicola]
MTQPPPRLRVVPHGDAEPPILEPDDAPDQPPRPGFHSLWTADRLMEATFPEPKWAVPGILAEGVTVLAGPPKVGKSWLSLGLGLQVAAGGTALGTIPVNAGPVLYLALEDTPRRLQSRMGHLLAGRKAPAALHLETTCPPLNQGGDHLIAGWLTDHPDARMVVIDVFAKVRGQAAPGVSAYDADYAAVGRPKKIADHFGVAIVLVHHVRKQASDDFLAEVSGTNGLAGAADTTIVLKRARGKADGFLHVTGRDVDEAEHAMQFDKDTGNWSLLPGPASEHAVSDTRSTVIAYVRDNPYSTPKQIAEGTGLAYETVKRACPRIADSGDLRRGAGGTYAPPLAAPDHGDNAEPTT